MASTIQELIKKSFSIHFNSVSDNFKQKLDIISIHFGSIKSFLEATREDFEKIVFVFDNPNIKFNNNDFDKIQSLRESGLLDITLSVQENFVKILTNEFIGRQLKMIEGLKLEELNVNPILIAALNLNNENDMIRYYVYQGISRSIVTSVGFLVQNLLLYSNENIYDGKNDPSGEQTKWDLVVTKIGQIKTYLEAKSGTNDINKSQIHHYIPEILAVEDKGFRAFIGETYGKRDDKTVTHGLFKQYLPDWEKRTLVGKELWAFLTDDTEYHNKLIDMLFNTSNQIMGNNTFIEKIEDKIKPLIDDFRTKYFSYNDFLNSLW